MGKKCLFWQDRYFLPIFEQTKNIFLIRMIDKLVLQFETCPENRDLVKFLRFFDTQIDILSPINFLLCNYMFFMPINHIKKVSCKNIKIYSF